MKAVNLNRSALRQVLSANWRKESGGAALTFPETKSHLKLLRAGDDFGGAIRHMPLPSFTTKDEYIEADLRRRFDDADDMMDLISIIEMTRYFQYHTLAKQMIADLRDEEKTMWQRHVRRRE